ncbi:MAG: hypothetical protein BGO14_10215 [Chlamydiales bacterium 38-26]|nr:hypothetical protein [Chlamydiales bacterium]OJV11338.1 MAG: hypothetical protein BGO14_10215 [Chlamydiales bacterium 38-26]
MRKIIFFVLCLALLGAGWWFWTNNPDLKNTLTSYVENGEFQTLEARYTPQQIMDSHQSELLGDKNHQYLEPQYKYHPYVLMEVKYTSDKKTREGVILWSLVDGEMVLNTENWERTHGFEDAINAKTTKEEFKILNALARSNIGARSKEELLGELQLDADIVNPWIESALDKQLITRKGNVFQLHFENPKILVTPQTKFNRLLVSKPYSYSQRVPEKYSVSQVEKIAKAAFGNDFSIRRMTEVYLPVYGIYVENPDGSTTITYWNAVTGQMIHPKYFKS